VDSIVVKVGISEMKGSERDETTFVFSKKIDTVQ
jgi:hypothetical protein